MKKQRKQRKSTYDDLIREHWAEICDEYPLPIQRDYCKVILKYRNALEKTKNAFDEDGIQPQISRSLKRLSDGPDSFLVKRGNVYLPRNMCEREKIGQKIIQNYSFAQPDILNISNTTIAISFNNRVTIQLKLLFKTYCGEDYYDVVAIDTVLLIFLKDDKSNIVNMYKHILLKKQLEKLALNGYYKNKPLPNTRSSSKPDLEVQSLPTISNNSSLTITETQ